VSSLGRPKNSQINMRTELRERTARETEASSSKSCPMASSVSSGLELSVSATKGLLN
jgi:hypothetical protein